MPGPRSSVLLRRAATTHRFGVWPGFLKRVHGGRGPPCTSGSAVACSPCPRGMRPCPTSRPRTSPTTSSASGTGRATALPGCNCVPPERQRCKTNPPMPLKTVKCPRSHQRTGRVCVGHLDGGIQTVRPELSVRAANSLSPPTRISRSSEKSFGNRVTRPNLLPDSGVYLPIQGGGAGQSCLACAAPESFSHLIPSARDPVAASTSGDA